MTPRILIDRPVGKEEMIVISMMSSATTVTEGDITLGIADPVSAGPDLPGVVIEIAGEDATLDRHVITGEEMIGIEEKDVKIEIPDLLEDRTIILKTTIENATIPQKKEEVIGIITGEDRRETIIVAGKTATTQGPDRMTAAKAETEEISIETTPKKESLDMIPQKKILLEVKMKSKKKENLVKMNLLSSRTMTCLRSK